MESHVIRSLVDEMIDIVAISETENFLGNSGDSTVDAMGEMTEVGTDKKVEKLSKKKLQGGNICCITGCHTTSRRNKGVGLFKPTNIKNEYHKEWRTKIDQIILRTRTPDAKYRELVEKKKIFICEKHYQPGDIEFTKTGLKKVKLGCLPSLNLPVKSHEVPEKARKLPATRNDTTESQQQLYCYKDFDSVLSAVSKMKMDEWNIVERDNVDAGRSVVFRFKKSPELLPRYEVIVDCSMEFSVFVYDWPLPDEHQIYRELRRSLKNIKIRDLLSKISNLELCGGVGEVSVSGTREHFVQHERSSGDEERRGFNGVKYFRPDACCVLSTGPTCASCSNFSDAVAKKEATVAKKMNEPLHPNRPLCTVPNNILIQNVKELRAENKKLRKMIERSAVKVGNVDESIFGILESNSKSFSPFVKLFWEEQKSLLKTNPTGRRYHPMIIRFALSLMTKSPGAYEELQKTGILALPCSRTLRDYRNVIKPKTGINPQVVDELIEETKGFVGSERFVCLSLDEMKVQSDLVFARSTGELIGFVDLGEPDINMATLKDHDDLATHVLVFYLRGLRTHLKFSFAYYATKGLLAHQLFPIFWRAVNILEIRCKLPVIAVVCDGAGPNRNFFRLHMKMSGTDPVYKVRNLFAQDRWIYFISDPPHLIKTLRNCLWHSKPDGSRLMWNNGRFLEWKHICQIVGKQYMTLKGAPALTQRHVQLNSYTIMNVLLATQTMSNSVSTVLQLYCGPETHGTAELCGLANKFFDICNIRHLKQGLMTRKEDMEPFRSKDDPRLDWLVDEFLEYFHQWKDSIDKRDGFTPKQKEKMFISHQTYEGLIITVKSIVEVVRFCLDNGFEFVLTERFMQDVLEQYFGLQRSMGRRSDNPNVYAFGYGDNSARTHRSNGVVKGNTAGAFAGKKQKIFYEVDNSNLKKRK